MYLNSRLIASGGAQLQYAEHSGLRQHCLEFTESGKWITCQPRLVLCVLFTFAELRFNPVNNPVLVRHRMKRWRRGRRLTGRKEELLWWWQTKVRALCCFFFYTCNMNPHSPFPPLLQWAPVTMWTRAPAQSRRSSLKIIRPSRTQPPLYRLFLVFRHLLYSKVRSRLQIFSQWNIFWTFTVKRKPRFSNTHTFVWPQVATETLSWPLDF